jgi:ankyrin repeat protein
VAGIAAAPASDRLVEAVAQRDNDAAWSLIKQHVDVNARQADGTTALHWATHWDDVAMVEALIRSGADVNVVNELGVAPLSLACINRNNVLVKRLIEAGANPNARLPSGESALMTAARTGGVDVVETLLAHHAEVNTTERIKGQTALMWAASEGHTAVVDVLLRHGADVRARSALGSTPLLFAARAGDLATVRALVAAGADVNEAEPVLPLPAGADANEVMPGGNSALLLASASVNATSGFEYSLTMKPSGHEPVALFLLENGADPSKTDTIGTTPLHAAVRTAKVALVKALLARGTDPNARLTKAPPPLRGDFVAYTGHVGATPFWLAANARYPNLEILRALVAAGADPRVTVQDGTTPLMAAVGMAQNDARLAEETSALEVVKALVEVGADMNATNRAGQTALHGATRSGRNAIVQFLAEHGATLDAKDKQGRTPLDVAQNPIRPLEQTAALLRRLAGAPASDAR